ncbi:sugar phosphate isomerase/epimerase family protein [Acidisoma sp. C75]
MTAAGRIGIFAKTFPGTRAADVLRAARAAGYGSVQFNLACCGLPSLPGDLPEAVPASIAAASREAGIGIAALSATYNMIHPDPLVRARGRAGLGRLIAAAPRMGTRLVTLCTGTRDAEDQWRAHPENASAAAWADLLAEMEQAAAMAEAAGVDLGIEPEPANVVADSAAAARLIAELASPRLRIVLDPANLVEGPRQDQARLFGMAVERLGPRLALAHAKDRDAAGEVVPAGQGIIDFPLFFAHLAQAGFTGPIITHGLAAEDAPGVARFLTQALAA